MIEYHQGFSSLLDRLKRAGFRVRDTPYLYFKGYAHGRSTGHGVYQGNEAPKAIGLMIRFSRKLA